MKHIKRLWLWIPRPVRAVGNCFGILFLILAIYYCKGSPSLTLHQAFRRAERANLVGPGTIVSELDWSLYSDFRHLIVAETAHGVSFFADCGYTDATLDERTAFSYREKTGDLTLLAAPSFWPNWQWTDYDHTLPIYLFGDFPQADHGELEIDITGQYQVDNDNYDTCSAHFDLISTHQENGHFLFWLSVPGDDPPTAAAAQLLTAICADGTSFSMTSEAHQLLPEAYATVRLYDAENNLILERELTLRTVSAAAQAKQGNLE